VNIAILTIGDELLNGDLADTNTAAIAAVLGKHSFRIAESVSIGDADADIAAALQRLARTYQVVIVTGGLGPTEDDRTARAAARAFGRSLSLNDEALRQIRARFAGWGRAMHPRNEKQALLPGKSTVLANLQGTAPGFRMILDGKNTLFFLPGVPTEMLAMLEEHVLPFLRDLEPEPAPEARRLFTVFGLAEPDVEARLARASLPEAVSVAFAVDLPFVQVKLRASGDAAEHFIDQAELVARQTLGDAIVGFDDDTLAGATIRALTAAGLTLALAESCTGGMIAQQLTDQSGASAVLERGVVSYANRAKHDWLGVSEEILNGPGAVSAECALAMARGVMAAADTRIGLAVTGIAGPTGGTQEKPVGTVFIAMVTKTGQRVERFRFSGNRQQVRLRTTCTALDWLRRLAFTHLENGSAGLQRQEPREQVT
jgi:nicotinamide-nucleotide amidase